MENDVALTRDDCVTLFHKYNCTLNRYTGKLCSDLNACI
jgi:hypothetical protein